MTYDPLRAYDTAVTLKLGATVPQGQSAYSTVVDGITAPVPVLFGLEEDWFTRYTLPAINIKRMLLPAPARTLAQHRAQELSTNPATPHTWNIQVTPSQPVNFLYDIELAATSQAEFNALILHIMLTFPSSGYGTSLTVDGTHVNYHGTGGRDETNYQSKDGRLFRYCYEYTVEGWIAPSLECEKVPQILTIDVDLEVHTSTTDLHTQPPPSQDLAVEIVSLTLDAPSS